MKLLSLKVEGFGKISELPLHLNEHLNVIYGKNESGKTTLKAFIYGMLYGFLRPKLYRRYYEDEQERYRPWQVEKYGGELVYVLDSGQKIMVQRDFDSDEVTIRDAETWEDLTKEFPVYLREPQFAQVHLGIEKEIFRDCLYIKQQNIDAIENPQALTSRLQSIATTSTEELSLQKALGKLQKALDRIGTERARKTSLLGQYIERIERLQQEREEVLKKHAQFTASIEELSQLNSKRTSLLDAQQKTQYLIARVELERIEERIEKVNRLNQKIDQKQQELIPLKAYDAFPDEGRDVLIQLNADFASQKKRQSELEEELQICQDELKEIRQKLPAYAHLEGLAETSTDEIAEKKREWIDFENDRKELKQTIAEQEEAFRELELQGYEHSRFSALNQQTEAAKAEFKEAEEKHRRAEYHLLCAELNQIQNAIKTIKELKTKINETDQTLQNYEAYADFPAQRKDELLNLQTRFKDANERVEQLKEKLEKQRENLAELQDELKPFSGYKRISENLEEIGRLESKYELLVNNESQQRENFARAKEKVEAQSDQLSIYESKFRSLDQKEFEQVLQDVTNLGQNQTILSLREREINRETERLRNLQNQFQRQKGQIKLVLSASGGLIVTAVACFWFLPYLSLVLAPLGLGGLIIGFQKRKQAKVAEAEYEESATALQSQKSEIARKQEELADAQRTVEELFERVGVSSVDELKTEYARLQKQRQEVKQLNEKVEETSCQLEAIRDELRDTEELLQNFMEPVISQTEGSIPERLAALREGYRQYQSLLQQSETVEKEERRLQSELEEAEEKANELEAQMTQILVEANLETVEQFLQAVGKRGLYQEAAKQKAELEEKPQTHLTGKSLEDLEAEKHSKQEQLKALIDSHPMLAQVSKESVVLLRAKAEYEQFSAKKREAEQTLRTLQTQRETRFSESIQAQRQRITESQNQLRQIEERLDALEEELRTILVETELLSADAPFSIELVDTLLSQINQYNQLKQKEVELLKMEREQVEKLEKAKTQLDKIQTQRQSLLLQAGVETFEAYNEAWNKHRQFLTLNGEIQDLIKERDSRLGEQTFEEWRQQAQECKRQIENLIENRPELLNLAFARNDETKYQKDLKYVKDGIQEIEKQIHGIQERIQIQMGNSRPLYEIEEELEQATFEKQKLEKQREALALAKEQLEAVSQEFITTRFAPELREIVAPMLQKVTGRYGEMRFDEELNIKVRIPELNLIKEVETLSQGTLDQIYFLLKSGIAQMLSKNRETLPLLLDDPFVTCDDERLERILDMLGKLANQTQILLFTCHRWQMYAITEHFGYDAEAHALDVGEFALLSIAP